MPESKKQALKRAKRIGFSSSSVVKATGTKKYFIAPRGVTKTKAKKAYAGCRAGGGSKQTCAGVSWRLQKKK